jgi:formamidopyrimidine-DNA glycosylase
MPELPEVETVRRDLARTVVGRRLGPVAVTGARTVRSSSAAALRAGARGRTVVGSGRRGKYLLLELDSGQQLVIHLRMSGQLLLAPARSPRPKHTHVAFGLGGGEELRFVDPRTFGEVMVVDPDHVADQAPGLARLGPDAWEDIDGPGALGAVVRSRSRALKALLLDQRALAGLGNIYADEIVHRAGISPWRISSSLSTEEIAALYEALRTVLAEAIDARGSSLGDDQYIDLTGRSGTFQERHQVYGRGAAPCLRCGSPIERVRWAGRSTHWCPACQR